MLHRVRPPILRVFGIAIAAATCLALPGETSLSGREASAPPQNGRGADLWLAPPATARPTALARAVQALNAGKPEDALPIFAGSTSDPVLGGYALLYMGRAQLALGKNKEAEFSATQVTSTSPQGYLAESALWLTADAAEAASDWDAAATALTALTKMRSTSPASAFLRLGRDLAQAGRQDEALAALSRVYYDFPLTSEASDAADTITKMAGAIRPTAETYLAELARAHQLYDGGRYSDARKAYDALRGLASGDDRELIDLRLGQCDYYTGRYSAARDTLRAIADRPSSSRAIEAEYYLLGALRGLHRDDDYVSEARAFIDAHPDHVLAEAALDDLGTHFILANDDEKAAAAFAELYAKYPTGPHADRAAWKSGWWAYKNGEYAEAVRVFESAAATLGRSNYRPSWLYWAARAHAQLGERDAALNGYRAVIADYRNSYYGREAVRESATLLGASVPAAARDVAPARADLPPTISGGPPPENSTLVQALLTAGLYDDAIGELRAAQRVSGTSPLIEATIAWALKQRGDLRPAISAMRRAYPQFMSAGGEALPTGILTVIFPLEYWSLIGKYSSAHKLDPYLVAALIAQESTFQADVRSAANAWGLMQVLPSTGRRYARTLGIRSFSTRRLTDAETNIRIGTAYFADLIKQFGDTAPALAAYNAGENRVARWLSERPGIDRDEFVDDIPFPETQNYVKRILGTAEDYRWLYRDRQAAAGMGESGR